VLLDGRVQKDGDRIRLSVQLVRAADGVPIWAEQFDGKFTDIFAVQDEISRKVVAKLSLQLTGEENRGLTKRYTDNVEAYQLYLKGLYHWSTFSREGLLTSLNFYNAAIEKDSRYALAFAGLANTYNVIGIYGPLPTSQAMKESSAAALKAVELDDTLPEAHVALGAVKLFHEWDWPAAERELRRAIELAPDNPHGHSLYGYYLQAQGRTDEAVAELQKAADAAPQWPVAMHDVLEGTFIARRYDEVIARCLEAQKFEPNEPFVLWVLGRSYTMKGMHEQAIAQFERGLKAVENEGPESTTRLWLLSGLGYAQATVGRREDSLKVVDRMRKSQSRWKDLYIAFVLAGLGDKDQAFASLNEAYERRFPFLWHLRCVPEFDSLRSDPRYAELLRRINLAQ
jgi:tetratricopeptide (TPR) repeat protein